MYVLVYPALPGRQAVVLEVVHPVMAVDNCLLSKQKKQLEKIITEQGSGSILPMAQVDFT
jgi:hypothetical protein